MKKDVTLIALNDIDELRCTEAFRNVDALANGDLNEYDGADFNIRRNATPILGIEGCEIRVVTTDIGAVQLIDSRGRSDFLTAEILEVEIFIIVALFEGRNRKGRQSERLGVESQGV